MTDPIKDHAAVLEKVIRTLFPPQDSPGQPRTT